MVRPLCDMRDNAMVQRMVRALVRFIPLAATITLACSAPAVNGSGGAANPTVIHASPALWVVSDSDTTIYLFGTVHMLKPEIQWLEGNVKRAFDRADTLVVEVAKDDPSKLADIATKLSLNTNGPAITQALSPRQRDRYLAALKTYSLPAQAMDRFDPWYVSITLSVIPLMQLGYRQDLGADKVLETAAGDAGKTIIGLETAEQQLGFFENLPSAVQIKYLNSTVKELPKVRPEFARLIRDWAVGKPEALAKQMNKSLEETPELAMPLLLDRNARWVEWIEKRMEQPGTIFMAVGAGHLAGTDSVIDLLERQHISVRRIHPGELSSQ